MLLPQNVDGSGFDGQYLSLKLKKICTHSKVTTKKCITIILW